RLVRLLGNRSKQEVFATESRRIKSKDPSEDPSPLRRGPATSTTAGKSKHARRSLRNLNNLFSPATRFTFRPITLRQKQPNPPIGYFDADDHDNTSRPSMLMAYGICTLENQFNSYHSARQGWRIKNKNCHCGYTHVWKP
ncbi:hypothetical protein E4U48_005553, partial [Claviceps purpurea]